MQAYRFDSYTKMCRPDSFYEPKSDGQHWVGFAAGCPRGQWSRRLVGTDCNGNDQPVVLILESGHRIQDDGRVVDKNITDVRFVHVEPDYTAEETADLILSACQRAGIPVNADAHECLMRNIARDIRHGFVRS